VVIFRWIFAVLNVLITIDTEVWPRDPDWRETLLAKEFERDFIGRTPAGDFGVPYQIEVFNRHGLKAVFHVESLFASAIGLDPLSKEVAAILAGRQEVQLHLHPEWLAWIKDRDLPASRGPYLHQYSVTEQTAMLRAALSNLAAAGAGKCTAFRAGNFGANLDSLEALSNVGIRFDTSHNTAYLGRGCELNTGRSELQPRTINGVLELPIGFVRDGLGQIRHCQLGACSLEEICGAMCQAWERGWQYFVVVSHSFELVRRRDTARGSIGETRPDETVLRRFHGLCEFLAQHSGRFRTIGFNDIDADHVSDTGSETPLTSSFIHTLKRSFQQARRRYWADTTRQD